MRSIPFLAFFLSGASSLVFQTLWTRMLHHVFGATHIAISSVLTVFMAGLGLGAWWFGRHADRMRRPLLVYAAAELGVGVSGAVIPWLVRPEGWLAEINALLRESFGAESGAFMAARFACIVPILIVPTTLMGSTLPLLARHFVGDAGSADDESAKVGTLYAVNTLGAVVGTFVGGFVLMPRLGVSLTNVVAVSCNFGLAAGIYALRHRLTAATASAVTAPPIAAEPEDPQPADAAVTSPLVRRVALLAFAVSGACALAYEVVWSRALSMVIGSSVHAFVLILDVFLIGIAGGSALLSPMLAQRDSTASASAWRVLPIVGPAMWMLPLLGLLGQVPSVVFDGLGVGLAAGAFIGAAATGLCLLGLQKVREERALGGDGSRAALPWVTAAFALPFAGSLVHTVRALTASGGAVSAHGYLPFIVATVVGALCVLPIAALWLRGSLVVLAAVIQTYVALCTFAGYVFQDEVPYTFARLVSSLDDLPNHVGTVRFFMFLTAALCTLPATLGMGAMFPVTLRLYTAGPRRVARDVGTVYTVNTVGSILGSWLPGFLLMPLLGMERTLHLGIWLNLAAALALVVSADPPGRTQALRPRWLIYTLALSLAPMGAGLYAATRSVHSPLRWDLGHMTLGAFRISLARDVLDPQSWGEPDLVYYRDGVSTTVSVEKWGRHLAMKNNGKVDASNGDDMPTQIMVAAYPLLLHPAGSSGLKTAIVGYGSGVTVGAALQFPVSHVDAVELEKHVVEAAADFFGDVSHLPRAHDTFPYVSHPRLTVHNDDGRNFLAASRERYDVIVSEPSNPWITGVSDLFTVDHFRITKKRLAPGGVYCQWVQLYELSPANIKTIYRTFAEQFEHVLVFAAEDVSSDTILVGSDRPLAFDLGHLERALADPKVAAELERAYVHSAQDVVARTLFSSREEVLTYTQVESRLREGRWHADVTSTNVGACPIATCRRTASPLNTDDNMRIEFAAPEDLIGFARYDGYLRTLYGPTWPFGKLQDALTGLGEGAQRASRAAQLALSLAAHGRKRQAAHYARLALQADGSDSPQGAAARRANEVLHLLWHDAGEPHPRLTAPEPGPQLSAAAARQLNAAYESVRTAVAQGDYPRALTEIERIPNPLRLHSGAALRFLYGYLLYKGSAGDGSALRSAVYQLEATVREDDEYTADHPEAYYFLARALDAVGSFDKAVRNMVAFVIKRAPPPTASATSAAPAAVTPG